MQIQARGLVSAPGGAGRAVAVGPDVTTLSDGSLIASYRIGTDKDDPQGTCELRSSTDNGETWGEARQPFATRVDGVHGSIAGVYITELSSRRLLAALLWVDRDAYPGKPLFNPETEGCLPLRLLLSRSDDNGSTWSDTWAVDTPDTIGLPAITCPVLRLADGRLALSLESNKQYQDASPWMQRVVYLYSEDEGESWGSPIVVTEDPSGRIFNWDQRAAVAADGSVVTFTWTYDSSRSRYLNVHRRISGDGGYSWGSAEDLGFRDQPSVPAIFPDGSVVLAWVDRYGSQSIRARRAAAIDAPFDAASEVVVYDGSAASGQAVDRTGELLAEMVDWSYGLPCAAPLNSGEAIVLYYAGDAARMGVHWARLG